MPLENKAYFSDSVVMMPTFQYQFQDVDLNTNELTYFSGCPVSYIHMISSDGKKNQATFLNVREQTELRNNSCLTFQLCQLD